MNIYIVYHPDNTIWSVYFHKESAESDCQGLNESSVDGGFYVRGHQTKDEPNDQTN
jgi:hypothetical protein